MQSYQPTPAITIVRINPAREDHAVTSALQFHLHDRHPYQVYVILLLRGEGSEHTHITKTH